MKKRTLTLFVALSLVVGLMGCGGNGGNKDGNNANKGNNVSEGVPDYLNTDSQFPIVKEGTDITLKDMIVNVTMYSNMNSIHDVYFVDAYEK